jgi:RHS repeat-associated protein
VTEYWRVGDNRLMGVNANNHTISYEYDRAGMRTAQTVDGVRTNYLLDVSRENPVVVAEYSPAGTPITTYTYGVNSISQQRGSDESFFLMDGHSGVRILTDKLGNLTDTSSYDTYGNVTNPLSAEFGYRGESFEDLTRLQYLRARYYEPSTGRFLGVDPFEGAVNSPVSRHRYLYGNANPVSYSDPSGKISVLEVSAVLSLLTISLTFSSIQLGLISLQYLDGLENLNWDGSFSSVSAGGLLGLPPFAVTAGGVNLTSDFYKGRATEGRWIILGMGVSSPWSLLPVSGSTSPSVTITTPRIYGNGAGLLGGPFTMFSVSAATPGFGVSYSDVFMGVGSGLISSPNPAANQAYGIDLSAGAFTGVSIPVWWRHYHV